MSSAYYKSHWMWRLIKQSVVDMYKGKAIFFAMDLALTLRHGIKTKAQLIRAKNKADSLIFEMEYLNLMVGGSENQYYSFDLVSSAQTIKKAFYPKTQEEYLAKKKNRFGDIKVVPGEIRMVVIDIAISESRKNTRNDLSVIKCVRAIPSRNTYERQEVYTESFEGCPIEEQAIKVRRIYEDFQADVIVYDGKTYGIPFADAMAKPLYDEERDKEYPPIKTKNREELKARCKAPGAAEIMYAYMGTAETNHILHTQMKAALMSGKYKMLVGSFTAQSNFLEDKVEYVKGTPADRARYLKPYLMSDLTLNEMINLSQTYTKGSTNIKLEEPSTGTKDKYMVSGMANYYVQQELEVKLTKKEKKVNRARMSRFRKPNFGL